MTRARRADGEITRGKILEAAGRLIAARGFAHTTSKNIAEEAGADLAAVNYYFGGRDGLYRAVLAEGHSQLLDLGELTRLAESSIAPRDKLIGFIELVASRILERPGWYGPVFARELLSPSPQLHTLFKEEVLPKFRQLQKILSEVTGIPEVDPALLRCALSVLAPCLMLLVARGAPGPMQQVLSMEPARVTEHLGTFALAGLDAISRDYNRQRDAAPVRGRKKGA